MTLDFRALLAGAADESLSTRNCIGQVLTETDECAHDDVTPPQPYTESPIILGRDKGVAASTILPSTRRVEKQCLSTPNADSDSILPIKNPRRVPSTSSVTEFLPFAPVMRRFDELCLNMVKSVPFQNATILEATRSSKVARISLNKIGLQVPLLFRSVCICDPKMMGHPVRLRSKYFSIGPRGLKIGGCDYANLENNIQGGDSCKLTSRPDVDGRPKFILEYADWLVHGERGFPTWIIGAQVDVTATIHDLVTASGFENLRHPQSQHPQSQQAKCRPPAEASRGIPINLNDDEDDDSGILMDDEADIPNIPLRLSIHDNKSFLFHNPDDDYTISPSKIDSVIDWLEAAYPLPRPTRDKTEPILGQKDNTTPVEQSTQTPASAAFRDLVKKIAHLHRFSFVLSPTANLAGNQRFSPTGYWQVAAMSPHLFAHTADRQAVLSHTPLTTLHRMGVALSRQQPVSFLVNWGLHGVVQRLYCSPMLNGPVVACWLCFLVDPAVEDLWGHWGNADGQN